MSTNEKAKALKLTMDKIEKDYGKGSVMMMNEKSMDPIEVVSTGSIGLDAAAYGTHSLRRTKATLIYRRTRNLRAVQLLLGHTKLKSTVRYLGIEVDDALERAEQTEV